MSANTQWMSYPPSKAQAYKFHLKSYPWFFFNSFSPLDINHLAFTSGILCWNNSNGNHHLWDFYHNYMHIYNIFPNKVQILEDKDRVILFLVFSIQGLIHSKYFNYLFDFTFFNSFIHSYIHSSPICDHLSAT